MKRERPIRQIRILYLYSFLLFLQPLRHFVPPPLYFCVAKTPRHAAGHGKGGGCYKGLSFPVKESPCYTNLRYLFILLNSEKYEPRSAAAVIGLLARRYGRRRGLRNSLRSDSPRPFPSVFLASSPPDKGGIGDCALACILTPSVLLTPPSFGHRPCVLRREI